MSIKLRVRENSQIVTPIRFARFGQGELTLDQPDPDDRGFQMGERPFGWGKTDARGAMVGISAGQNVKVAVLREDLESAAPLFLTTDPPDLVELVSPKQGTPLGRIPVPVGQPQDFFEMRGLQDVAFRCGKVQVRFGSAAGPVLGELEVHIFNRKTVRVVAWLVTIQGIGPNLRLPGGSSDERLVEELIKDFGEVDKVFRPAGIAIKFQPERTERFTIDKVHATGKKFRHKGKVQIIDSDFTEWSAVVNEKFRRDAVNVYFVHRMSSIGATLSAKNVRPGGHGIVIQDGYKGFALPYHVLAHELSHYLDTDHPDLDFRGDPLRGDMWSRRSVMFSNTFFQKNPPHHRDLGYGKDVQGQLVFLKNLLPDDSTGPGSHCALMRLEARRIGKDVVESKSLL